ncbi:MAG: rRNA maturation RNase YbeY [Alphaproteobacteria bacterium]|nr:rRNA maturation RNase YbeY [Alphaproteobacteria bacterium]
MAMPLDLAIEVDAWSSVPGLELMAEQAVAAALPDSARGKVITLLFSDDATMQDLNRDWRGKDAPTNVLSFPAPEDQVTPPGELELLGDIVLGYETCAREADEAGKPLAEHACHLIVHGVLHLLGYDHIDDKEAEAMEAAEAKILATLGIANPYMQN